LKYLLEDNNVKGKIDLCYIDPPFATNSNFTITNGRASTISNSINGNIAYSDKLTGTEFIAFLKERLLLIKIYYLTKALYIYILIIKWVIMLK